jgi:serine/threonine protein kinase
MEGTGSDASRSITKSGRAYHCECVAGLVFAEPLNPRNNTCVAVTNSTQPIAVIPDGQQQALAGGAGVAAASAGGGVTAQTEVAAAAGAVVGAGLLVVGLAARRKREDEDEDEDEEVDAKRRRIVWSDSMGRETFVDESDAKARAREDALQVGLMMGARMANRKNEEGADDLYRSSKMLGRLDDVRLDGEEDGADADMPAWMMSGWVVDKKEIEYLSELGAGAFGAVSLVRVRGTLMAAKQLNPDADPTRDEARRAELLREVKAMAELQHTNVVRIFGVCMDPGHTCVLMEFAQNGTVRDLLDKAQAEGAPLPAYAVFGLMRGVVLGMRHAHAHTDRDGTPAPILHRDLKTANILLTEGNSALVSDFGLATDGSDGDAGAGGTLAYSPPEVLQGMAGQDTGMVDVAGNPNASGWSTSGDMYSFGVLAWELATGQVPYVGANARSLFQDVVHGGKRCHGGRFDALAEEGKIDPFFASIIERAWAQDRADRPTFKDLSEEFERMANEPRFQTPSDVYGDLDALMVHSSGRESQMRSALQDIDARASGTGAGATSDVQVDVASLLAAEEERYSAAYGKGAAGSAVARAKEDGDTEAKNVLTETFANFYTDVFGNNKADDDDDDLEAMV